MSHPSIISTGRRLALWAGGLCWALWLVGCASGNGNVSSVAERVERLDALAAARQWQKLRLPTADFVLTAYAPPAMNGAQGMGADSPVLTVYIEGDGLAWRTSSRPSDDPTPRSPVGLELALRHPAGAVAYLARPCQNVLAADKTRCAETYWTDRRYAPEVVAASDHAISLLKDRFKAQKLMLVGYSGGGAVAALVAARRSDVVRLVTVAANMDTAAWTALHRISPLLGSLNPADAWPALQTVPQWHWVGERDTNVTAAVVQAYASRFPAAARPHVQVHAGFDHACCWTQEWAGLALQSGLGRPDQGR